MAVSLCGHVVTVEAFTLIAEAVGSGRGVRRIDIARPVGEVLDGCRTSVALAGRKGGARPEAAGTLGLLVRPATGLRGVRTGVLRSCAQGRPGEALWASLGALTHWVLARVKRPVPQRVFRAPIARSQCGQGRAAAYRGRRRYRVRATEAHPRLLGCRHFTRVAARFSR